ncbi:hypothetical protein [Vibrio phage vB_VpM-pA2SJ1]|uniref:Uncharacterized protein n=1 Tax=Vibrio phage vB_VpM-pA2SJ1 TaxID=3095964 RepID=A0AAX4J5V0_9CAUD
MRLTKLEQFKDLVGSSIVAIPTGNNRNRKVKEQTPVLFGVDSIGRKYVKLARLDENHKRIRQPESYDPKYGSTQSAINAGYSGNAGYIFFECLDDIAVFRNINKMKLEISEYCRFCAFEMSDEDVRTVHQIVSKYQGKR